jgi:ribosome biogenesis GTPase
MSAAGAPSGAAGLAGLGWDAGWQAAFAPAAAGSESATAALVPARVVAAHRGAWDVLTGDGGPVLGAGITGRLRHEAGPAELPVVGDWVAVDARPGEGAASVHVVLPRRTQLRRKAPADYGAPVQVLAANVDVILVATSLNRDLNARRVERFLTAAWESGARPVLVLTKVDLARDPVEVAVAEAQLEEVAAGVPVVATSAISGAGLDTIRAFLGAGRTVALVGSSGVGKSTLANALLGEERLLVREIREDDARGRHTTVGRQLVALPDGEGLLLDTPGLRELGLWDDGTGLDLAFADVAAAAESCRFSDCRHQSEPGCAVRAAVAEGALGADRFAGWQKLAREERYRALEMDAGARRAEKRRWAAIGKAGAARSKAKRGEWGR